MKFPRNADGKYARRPTRGLDLARVMCPDGGGLEYCWRLRLALEEKGVALLDRLFVTGLLGGPSGRIVGATAIHSRTGEFHLIKARATIIATNAITFRSGFVRDITGTGTLLAYRAGAALRNAEFATCGRARRSSTSKASPLRSRRARASPIPRAKLLCAATSRNGRTKPTCRASPGPWPQRR